MEFHGREKDVWAGLLFLDIPVLRRISDSSWRRQVLKRQQMAFSWIQGRVSFAGEISSSTEINWKLWPHFSLNSGSVLGAAS